MQGNLANIYLSNLLESLLGQSHIVPPDLLSYGFFRYPFYNTRKIPTPPLLNRRTVVVQCSAERIVSVLYSVLYTLSSAPHTNCLIVCCIIIIIIIFIFYFFLGGGILVMVKYIFRGQGRHSVYKCFIY